MRTRNGGAVAWPGPAKPYRPRLAQINVLLTYERFRELAQLCHPDKHAGSPLSNDVTLWLGELRKRLDKEKTGR